MDKILENFRDGIKEGMKSADKIDDGGPAYPTDIRCQHSSECPRSTHEYGFHGMSLRDWFAGMALQGFRSGGVKRDNSNCLCDGATVADLAYQDADAMLVRRQS